MFFKLVDVRDHFVVNKLACRFGNHAVLFSEIFRREDLLRRAVLNHEGTAPDYLFLFDYG